MGCTWVLYLGILPKKDVFLRIKSSFVADVFLRRKTTLFEERCLPSSTDIIYERRRLSSKKDVFSVFARTSGRPARWVTAKGTGPQGRTGPESMRTWLHQSCGTCLWVIRGGFNSKVAWCRLPSTPFSNRAVFALAKPLASRRSTSRRCFLVLAAVCLQSFRSKGVCQYGEKLDFYLFKPNCNTLMHDCSSEIINTTFQC